MTKTRGIVWFRSDLRLHDNEALTEAISACDEILPVYIFDDRLFAGKTEFGFDKIAGPRTQFIIESVINLRQQLLDAGSQLLVLRGNTEELLIELARMYRTKWLFCNRERTREEVRIQDAVEHGLWAIGQEMRYSRGKMLLYTADLPFPVTHTPDRFSIFKKEVSYISIRKPIDSPSHINTIDVAIGYGAIPSLEDFGKGTILEMNYNGGESEGRLQLEKFIESLSSDNTDSVVLSPWISHGCLSPKFIDHELKQLDQRGLQAMTQTYNIHLLRRDHFRFIGKKFGDQIFHRSGIQRAKVSRRRDPNVIKTWCSGMTGQPLVDAAMRALVSTGYIPYRLRVLVGSYFIHDLKQDWLVGAQFFESHLIDYDPCSNYGNWNRLAGVGPVKREEVQLNLEHQTKVLDPNGAFIARWLD